MSDQALLDAALDEARSGLAEEGLPETHEPDWKARKSLALAVTTETDGLVGAMSLALRLDHRRAELGYWIGVPYWNRGFAPRQPLRWCRTASRSST